MGPIKAAKKVFQYKIRALGDLPAPSVTEPDVVSNEADVVRVMACVAMLREGRQVEGGWKSIRETILAIQERLGGEQSKNNASVRLHTLKTLEKVIELAQDYIKIKDPTLQTEKSEKRIHFLADQFLLQPARASSGTSMIPDGEKSSYYLQKNLANKGMTSFMKIARGLGVKKDKYQCSIHDNIIPSFHDGKKPQDIFYKMDDAAKRQPTFYSCSDTAAATINHYQKLELPDCLMQLQQLKQKLEDRQLQGTEQAAKVSQDLKNQLVTLERTSETLNKTYHVVQYKPIIAGLSVDFRTADELRKLYNVADSANCVDYESALKSEAGLNTFKIELSRALYQHGPVSVTINCGSPLNDHRVVINGLVGDKICYVDSWNGQNKEIDIKTFIGMMRDDNLAVMPGGVSYSRINDIQQLERDVAKVLDMTAEPVAVKGSGLSL